MKKVILILIFFFNLIPFFNKEGRLEILHNTGISAQSMEGDPEGDLCYVAPEFCNQGDDPPSDPGDGGGVENPPGDGGGEIDNPPGDCPDCIDIPPIDDFPPDDGGLDPDPGGGGGGIDPGDGDDPYDPLDPDADECYFNPENENCPGSGPTPPHIYTYYGEGIFGAPPINTGQNGGQLPCTDKFLMPFNKIIHFSSEQKARIVEYHFNGGALDYIVCKKNPADPQEQGKKYSNAITAKTTTLSGVGQSGQAMITSTQTTYKFVCFDCVEANYSLLNAQSHTSKKQAYYSGSTTATIIYENIPDDLDYSFKIDPNSVEDPVVGAQVVSINKSNELYCYPLTAEDCVRGLGTHRDDEYLGVGINFRYYFTVEDWARDFCTLVINGALTQCNKTLINEKLDQLHALAIYNNKTPLEQALLERAVFSFYGVLSKLSCATDLESIKDPTTSEDTKFAAGALHELINTIDIVGLTVGVSKIVEGVGNTIQNNVHSLIDVIKQSATDMVVTGSIDYTQLFKRYLLSNISDLNNVYDKVKTIGGNFKKVYFTDCGMYNYPGTADIRDVCSYRQGEIFMMALPIVLTLGDYAVMKLTSLAGNYVARTQEAIKLMDDAILASKAVTNEVDAVIQLDKAVVRNSANVIESTVKNEVLVGTANSQLLVITTASNIIDAVKIAGLANEIPNLLNLSATKFRTSSLKIDPAVDVPLQTQVNDIIATGDITGTKTEAIQDILFHDKAGYTTLDAKVGSNNGFDGLYIKGTVANPTDIVVGECKQWGSGVAMSGANPSTGLPVQMSDAWIINVADRLIATGDLQKIAIGNMIKNNPTLVTKVVTTVNQATGDINVLKLGSY